MTLLKDKHFSMLCVDFRVMLILLVWIFLPGLRHCEEAVDKGEVFWESKLIKKLIIENDDYVREARPVIGVNKSVDVTIVPLFLRLDEINEATNTFTASIIMFQMWTDIRLMWNASSFGAVKSVRLPSSRLWLPDIVPYNAASSGNNDVLYEETVVVSNDGLVMWGPLMTATAQCGMDVTNFPFDSQICTIHMGSWLHNAREMDMKFADNTTKERDIPVDDLESVLPSVHNPYWVIVNGKVRAKLSTIQYGNDPYTILSITAHVKRQGAFYKYLAIGPGALIGFLVPVMFLLPTRSQEKNTFGMLMILGLTLLITVLADAIPLNHTSTPRVGLFYLITLVLISFSIILSILVSNISYRGARRRALPQWIYKAFLSRNGLRRILCIDQYSPVDNLFSETMRNTEEDHPESVNHGELSVTDARELDNVGKLESQIKDINKYLRYICGKMSAQDTYRNVNSDWEEFARVIDRVLFVVFFILYALTAVALLT